MSLLVGKIDEFLTFKEYFLSESIKPLKTEYGSNPSLFNNSRYVIYKGNIRGTCFIDNDLLYAVQYSDDGEIAFGVSSKIPKTEQELLKISFTDERITSKSALKVFNKIFYVLIDIIVLLDKKLIYFSSANESLFSLYSAMTKNKYFNAELNKIGYSDLYLEDGIFKTYRTSDITQPTQRSIIWDL